MTRKIEQVVGLKAEIMPVVAQSLDARIRTLESFKEELKVMPTDQLVAGYLKVRDFDTRLKQLKDAVRAELVDPERGRIFVDETVEVDERGHRYLMGSDGNELLAQKRVSLVLNVEKAEEVLKSKNLLEAAQDQILTVPNSEEAFDVLRDVLEVLVKQGRQDLIDRLDEVFAIETKINPKKIEALVALEQLDTKDVAKMYDEKVTYALTASNRQREVK